VRGTQEARCGGLLGMAGPNKEVLEVLEALVACGVAGQSARCNKVCKCGCLM
jgi:hypothetical protein